MEPETSTTPQASHFFRLQACLLTYSLMVRKFREKAATSPSIPRPVTLTPTSTT